MEDIDFGIVTFFKLVHPLTVLPEIVVIALGNVNSVNDVQFSNANCSIFVTEFGMSTAVSDVHPYKMQTYQSLSMN